MFLFIIEEHAFCLNPGYCSLFDQRLIQEIFYKYIFAILVLLYCANDCLRFQQEPKLFTILLYQYPYLLFTFRYTFVLTRAEIDLLSEDYPQNENC
jgi:hypothetical protein